jgi:hypothetical protein
VAGIRTVHECHLISIGPNKQSSTSKRRNKA